MITTEDLETYHSDTNVGDFIRFVYRNRSNRLVIETFPLTLSYRFSTADAAESVSMSLGELKKSQLANHFKNILCINSNLEQDEKMIQLVKLIEHPELAVFL